MRDAILVQRLTGSRRAGLLAMVMLVTGALVAGCGGSSGGSASAASRTRAASAPTSRRDAASQALAFAQCMRARGVPSFPDPQPGGGLLFRAGNAVMSSPAFRTAQAKCWKLLPGGGPPGPGSTTHPTAQTLAKLLRIARCMRQHGISDFPDPRTSVPSNLTPEVYAEVTDFDGAILLFPRTLNLLAPAYRQDLAACGAPPLGLRH